MRHLVVFMSGLFLSLIALSQTLPPPAATPEPVYSAPIYPKPRNDQVAVFHQERIKTLPAPHTMPIAPKSLNLREAIALALRTNPAVQVAELQRIVDKFGLETVLQTYRVQWSPFTLKSTIQNQVYPTWSAGTGIAVNAPNGTSVSIAHSDDLLGGTGSTTLTLTQQLLQGFGLKVGRIPYQNAIDNEQIAKLNFKNSVITTVINVITAYTNLVEADDNLDINQRSLKNQEQSVWQSKLQVQAGKMARSDLLQQQENLESTRLSMVQQEQSVRTTYQNFLSALGLAAATQLKIDRRIVINDSHIPSLQKCIELALKNNIAYQQALLQLNIDQRQLMSTENARKWSLSMTSAVTLGSQRAAVGQPITSLNTNPSLTFSLSVPIDNISLKSAVVSAKVAIEDAKINLEQQKEDLIRQVTNQLAIIQNQKQQLNISVLAVKLQKQTLHNTQLKLRYGKATVFEENSIENQLLQQQVNLVTAQITYFNDIETLHQTLGLTLDKWGIKLRY